MDYPPRSFPTFCSNSLTSIISSCAGYQNLSYKFAGFLFNVYCEISHLFLSLYFCFYALNNFVQPIHSTYHLFPAFHNHFHQPNLFFCQHLFSTICLNTSTANSAKPFSFFATISSASNHLNPFLFPVQPFHWVSLPSPPPPPAIFFGKTFHFLCFH